MASYVLLSFLYNTHKCKPKTERPKLKATKTSRKNGSQERLDKWGGDSPDLPAGGGAALFGGQRVVGGRWSRQLLVKVLNLLLVHLHHHRPLQLHGRACGTIK